MCRVIAVSNQKGGVGKTVLCVNLGIGLAQEGKKVLLVDADPQGSLTISLGYEELDEICMMRRTFLTSALDMPEIMSYIYSKSWNTDPDKHCYNRHNFKIRNC